MVSKVHVTNIKGEQGEQGIPGEPGDPTTILPLAMSDVTGLEVAVTDVVKTSSLRLPIVLTQAEYDLLNPPVEGQLYIISGE